jgi:WD40 repeat protein
MFFKTRNNDNSLFPIRFPSLSRVDDVVFSGSFDGSLLVSKHTNGKGLEVQSELPSAHATAVTSVSGFQPRNGTTVFVASASKDSTVAIRKLQVHYLVLVLFQ